MSRRRPTRPSSWDRDTTSQSQECEANGRRVQEGAFMGTTHVDTKELCVRAIQIMADGTPEDFEAVFHPDARNREAVDEPPATRGRGPAAFYATALWLRGASAARGLGAH